MTHTRSGAVPFAVRQAYRRYDLDAERNRVREELFVPICEDIARVQFKVR